MVVLTEDGKVKCDGGKQQLSSKMEVFDFKGNDKSELQEWLLEVWERDMENLPVAKLEWTVNAG